ncbi:phosphatidylserine decarboxylase [Sandarakinorhabdus sp.]|uniref:phosphatidylserine decarboxylase n=1 Tax=Sandarakinorhabdus sp. TaxID=1916663 RepID=UPI00286E0960|nr:phosphatidylserine decarboxylase [Sandarakinorhabdus sp.]
MSDENAPEPQSPAVSDPLAPLADPAPVAAPAIIAETPLTVPGTPVNAGPLPLVPGESAKYRIPDMHPEGRKFVGIALVAVLFFGFVLEWSWLAWPLAGVALWIAAFFRDPVRVTPLGEGMIVSPADGLVSLITMVDAPRQLVGDDGLAAGQVARISVFMNVFDVHINRAPIAGRMTRIVYVPGKFLNADLDKASDENERQYFVMEDASGVRVGFTQIAGLVARRIMKWVEPGQTLKVGERFGLIRFGSRVDVYLPAGYVPSVAVGQRAVAGETVLARRGVSVMSGSHSQ